jgi:hypothetical protein
MRSIRTKFSLKSLICIALLLFLQTTYSHKGQVAANSVDEEEKVYTDEEEELLVSYKETQFTYHQDEDEEDNDDFNDEEEFERITQYQKLGYTWPIPDSAFVPNTTGFIQHMRKRIEQVDQIDNKMDRWIGLSTILSSGLIIPNFTEHGFGITKCIDDELMDELRKTVREGYETAELEGEDISMPGPNPPVMVRNEHLTTRVYIELQRYAEAWSGMKLLPFGAYGFRVYRNGTQLMMHTDISETHIISFILHIDHSNDGSPWPLVIEDYHGNTHEVILESGDLLFYESAKILHGRPRPFNGTWYSSVFVHYYPAEGWIGRDIDAESSFAIPPKWQGQLFSEHLLNVPRMQLFDTGFTEPDCENQWCGLENSIKWGGITEAGYWTAPNMEKYPLDINPYILVPSEEVEEYEL